MPCTSCTHTCTPLHALCDGRKLCASRMEKLAHVEPRRMCEGGRKRAVPLHCAHTRDATASGTRPVAIEARSPPSACVFSVVVGTPAPAPLPTCGVDSGVAVSAWAHGATSVRTYTLRHGHAICTATGNWPLAYTQSMRVWRITGNSASRSRTQCARTGSRYVPCGPSKYLSVGEASITRCFASAAASARAGSRATRWGWTVRLRVFGWRQSPHSGSRTCAQVGPSINNPHHKHGVSAQWCALDASVASMTTMRVGVDGRCVSRGLL